jgi:Fur family ferric uptake transcriptional regulator
MSQLKQSSAWAERLREAGYRLTAPRRAVLRVLENAGSHLRPDEVLQGARAVYPSLGRATVYRTLALLTGLGLLHPIYLGEGRSRVARVEEGHHHLVCLSCGHSFNFTECHEMELEERIAEEFDFQVKGHLLEFYGLCADCREEVAHA